jgi:3' exoribonuclease family, domain 1
MLNIMHRLINKLQTGLLAVLRSLDAHPEPEACCAVLRTGTVSQATGSAYIEVGATKAMAGVYGPRPTDRREAFSEEGYFSVDVKLASFATRTRGRITQVL